MSDEVDHAIKRDVTRWLIVTLQMLGFGLVCAGGFLLATWLGYIVTGGGLFGVGIYLERSLLRGESNAGSEQQPGDGGLPKSGN